jgi:hypothetical protein
MAGRARTTSGGKPRGLIGSVIALLGLDQVPDYSTMSRWSKTLIIPPLRISVCSIVHDQLSK